MMAFVSPQVQQLRARRKNPKHPCRKDRFRATVVQIGETPKLKIDGGEEHFFAYRSVKKRPGEPRQILVVGDVVDCRLTKTVPAKAVSIKIVVKMPQPAPRYTHDPYKMEEPEPSLFAALGDAAGIDAQVDTYLDSLLEPKEKDMQSYPNELPDDILMLGTASVYDPISQQKHRNRSHSTPSTPVPL
eukprot:TRINITY_DN13074_c0_g1_i1.p1 TRINITY_DN13074_c0_g1~~TRINITY_DN13074_c0_g1_i1.p1  ORF type:complete len:187 (+),score=39.77 TRINITY_DN13074_c0_g1_i1:34-594(+)